MSESFKHYSRIQDFKLMKSYIFIVIHLGFLKFATCTHVQGRVRAKSGENMKIFSLPSI